MKRTAAFLVLASSLSCSVFSPKPAPYPEGVVFPLEEASRVEFPGRVHRPLVKTGGKLYFSTDKGVLYCLDEHGSKILWEYDAQAALGCAPAVGPQAIAAWDTANNVHGISPAGKALWKTALAGTASSDICLGRDKLYIGTREGSLYALSLASGEVLWAFKTGGAIEAASVAWYDSVVVASTDGQIYIISADGKLRRQAAAGAAVRVTPLADGDNLYYGADDESFNCLDLRSLKRRWRRRAEGRILAPPRSDGRRVYFPATNTVLYALSKTGGNIDWWKILPSRSPFSPAIAAQTVLASSASPVVVGLERRTGEETGRYDTGIEVRSEPAWSPPDILLALFDFEKDTGYVVRLRKQVKVELSSSVSQGAPVGAEVVFTASAVGFYLPKYEFYIKRDSGTTVAQEASVRNAWTWFPEKEGKVTIGVRVKDAKESREAELPFEVAKSKEVTKPK